MDEVKLLLDEILQHCEQVASLDPLNRDQVSLPVKVPCKTTKRPNVEIESNGVDSWSILPDRIKYLGSLPPDWQLDEDVVECVACCIQFNIFRRKHHCRSCGRVFCGECTSNRIRLAFCPEQDSRVCAECYELIPEVYRLKSDVIQYERKLNSSLKSGVNKKIKHVRFIDGEVPVKSPLIDDPDGKPKAITDLPDAVSRLNEWVLVNKIKTNEYDAPLGQNITANMKESGVLFRVRKSIYCRARLSTLSCCTNQRCLSLCTMGLCKVASDELLFVFEFGSITKVMTIINWLIRLIEVYYEDAGEGRRYNMNQCVDVHPDLLCPLNNIAAFIFTKPTCQCLANLELPENSYLIGIPLCKEEIPMAKCMPTRLLIQMGVEYNVYPFPLAFPLKRKPLRTVTDNSVLTILCDFKNFQFTMPFIERMEIRIEPPNTVRISIPKLSMPAMVEAFNVQKCRRTNRVGDMIALTCGISSNTDGYINHTYEGPKRFVGKLLPYQGTNMLFVVFLSSSMLSHRGFNCRRVEDGLVFHFSKRQMDRVANYLTTGRDKKFMMFDGKERQTLIISWTKGCKEMPGSLCSPIDGKCLDGFPIKRMVDPVIEEAKFSINWTAIIVLKGKLFSDLDQLYNRLSRVALEFVTCIRAECVDKPIALRISCIPDQINYMTNCEDDMANLMKEDLESGLMPILRDLRTDNAVYELHFNSERF